MTRSLKKNEGGTGKGVTRPQVAGRPSVVPLAGDARPSEWGSLLADLSGSSGRREPEWRIHDRTHLEFALDYDVEKEAAAARYEWDVYFFVPASLRLSPDTYPKDDIYEDLQSYVRYAAPATSLEQIPLEPARRLAQVLAGTEHDAAARLRELRLFACLVRAAGVRAERAVLGRLSGATPDLETAQTAALEMATGSQAVSDAFHAAIAGLDPRATADASFAEALRWIDEDVSRVLEMLLASVAVELRNRGADKTTVRTLAAAAVAQARYRRDRGLDGVGRAGASKREVEHLEFRRNVLKRFTASVLWLSLEVRQAATVVRHVLFGVAAAAAMAFALVAAFWNGLSPPASESFWLWMTAAVIAYAGKDRMKAWLQDVFARFLAKHVPDRRWRILDRERRTVLGRVNERAGFVAPDALPQAVLDTRRSGREHGFEDDSRPERILWHHKEVSFDPRQVARADARFTAITEIFRLNLADWLENTDDPKRTVLFADPDDWHVYSAVAPRVYNIAVVYRLARAGDPGAPWRRIRVVVTRKGVLRIDHVC